jgi:hypothetical protein
MRINVAVLGVPAAQIDERTLAADQRHDVGAVSA